MEYTGDLGSTWTRVYKLRLWWPSQWRQHPGHWNSARTGKLTRFLSVDSNEVHAKSYGMDYLWFVEAYGNHRGSERIVVFFKKDRNASPFCCIGTRIKESSKPPPIHLVRHPARAPRDKSTPVDLTLPRQPNTLASTSTVNANNNPPPSQASSFNMWKPTLLFTTLLSGAAVALPQASNAGFFEYAYYYHDDRDDDTYNKRADSGRRSEGGGAKAAASSARVDTDADAGDDGFGFGFDLGDYESRGTPEGKDEDCNTSERCSCRG